MRKFHRKNRSFKKHGRKKNYKKKGFTIRKYGSSRGGVRL